MTDNYISYSKIVTITNLVIFEDLLLTDIKLHVLI